VWAVNLARSIERSGLSAVQATHQFCMFSRLILEKEKERTNIWYVTTHMRAQRGGDWSANATIE